MKGHLCHFTIDQLALGLQVSDEEVRHLETCNYCREQVAKVSPLPETTPVPSWVTSVDEDRGVVRAIDTARPRSRLRRSLALGGALAAAACFAIFVLPSSGITPNTEHGGYVGTRGSTTVALYLKRDGEVRIWDGNTALAPGDKIRLEVAPGDFTNVAVFLAPAGELTEPTLLHSTVLTSQEPTLLEPTWKVDENGSDETLLIVLSTNRVQDFDSRFVDETSDSEYQTHRLVLTTGSEAAP